MWERLCGELAFHESVRRRKHQASKKWGVLNMRYQYIPVQSAAAVWGVYIIHLPVWYNAISSSVRWVTVTVTERRTAVGYAPGGHRLRKNYCTRYYMKYLVLIFFAQRKHNVYSEYQVYDIPGIVIHDPISYGRNPVMVWSVRTMSQPLPSSFWHILSYLAMLPTR